jgi:hypothetical protein
MKSYSIRFILFLVAFAIGTTAAILFWQENSSQVEISTPVNSDKDNNPNQPQSNQSFLTSSLSFNGVTRGCGDFIAYRATEDNTKVIAVKADKSSLKLGKSAKAFNIGTNKNIEVFLYDFGKDEYEGYIRLCFDAIRLLKPIKLTATSGKAKVSVSSVSENGFYNVTIVLEDITFQTSGTNTLNLNRVEIKNAHVGWVPG